MLAIELVCSDDDCAEETEVVLTDLDEVERLACECGCSFVVLCVSEAIEVRLPER